MTIHIPRWSIQTDWIDIVQNRDKSSSKFWLSVYDYEKNSQLSNEESLTVRILECRGIHENLIVEDEGKLVPAENFISADLIDSKTLKATRVEDGKCCEFIPYDSVHATSKPVVSLDLSQNEELIAVTRGDYVSILDVDNWKERRVLAGHFLDVNQVKFFPSGKVLLTGGLDMQLRIWDLSDGSCPVVLSGHKARVSSLGIIGRGRNVLSASRDGNIIMWECSSSEIVNKISVGTAVENIIIIPSYLSEKTKCTDSRQHETEGKLCAYVNEGGKLGIIDIVNFEHVFESKCVSPLTALCSIEAQNILCCGSIDGEITLWDCRNHRKPLKTLQRNNSTINSLIGSEMDIIVGSMVLFNREIGDGSVFSYNIATDYVHEFTTDENPVYSQCIGGSKKLYIGTRKSVLSFTR